jgi:predicted NUDIX family phosphoesterase
MSKKYNEDILCLPTATLMDIQWFAGFHAGTADHLPKIFASKKLTFVDRNLAEEDPSYKQLIPYIAVVKDNKYLTVQRSKKVGEQRLAGRRTACFAGHINKEDGDETDLIRDAFGVFSRGVSREILEELDIKGHYGLLYRGMINDNRDDVGKVHLGVFITLNVYPDTDITVRDEGLINPLWQTAQELRDTIDQYEGWSELIIASL